MMEQKSNNIKIFEIMNKKSKKKARKTRKKPYMYKT